MAAATTSPTAALHAYRSVLRAARLAFHGDTPLLHAAQKQARSTFQHNASLPPSDPATVAAIEHAQAVAQILRENVVQGKNVGGDMYRLRIHEDTERGDNDTIKMPGGEKVVVDGKTCADR